jgi:hypothetical protein
MHVRVPPRWGVLVLVVGVVLGAPGLRAQAKAGAVDLSGRWRLNKERSDDEQAKESKVAEAKPEPASAPSGKPDGEDAEGGRGGRSGATGGRTGHGSPAQGIDERDPRGARRSAGAPDSLTVTQVESEIVVEETPGQRRELYPNGRTYKTDEGATQIRTSWKDGKLVVERKNVRGWRLVETWELALDRGRLVIHLLLEGGARPKLNLTRVYDRYDADSPK